MINKEQIVKRYRLAREVVTRSAELLAFHGALLDMYNVMYNADPESSEDLQPRVLEAKAQHALLQERLADLQRLRNVMVEHLGFDPEDVA